MAKTTLYIGNKRYSSWSMRPWLLMKAAGIPFKETRLWIRKPDSGKKIDRVSPGGRVPALHDGKRVVWESLAICEYLAEQFPEKNLWPADPRERAVARSVSNEMHSGFQALRTHLPCNFVRRYKNFNYGSDVQPDIDRILRIWKYCLKHRSKRGPFLFGKFSIADAMFAPVVFRFLAYGVKVDPISRAYMKTIENHPAAKEWVRAASGEKERIAAYEFSDHVQHF